MRLALNLRTVNLGLLLLLILVMANQLGLDVPLGEKGRLPVTIADVVLVLAAAGVALQLLGRKLRGLRLPPVQAFVLVAVACVALARSESKPEAVKEVLQLAEGFLIAFAVFLNVAERGDVKLVLAVFAAATALVVLWAAWHYLRCDSPLDVRAGFRNRNALGAFLAIALPVLYGLALHVRCWGVRLGLLAIVALGLLVNLSGAAVLVTLLILGLLSALRGQKPLALYLAAIALICLAAPKLLPRPHHTDILFSSAMPYVSDNFLLSDRALFARASELRDAPTSTRTFDAMHLMKFLVSRRGGDLRRLSDEQRALYDELQEKTGPVAKDFPNVAADSAFAQPRLAVRYQVWHAAIARARKLWDALPAALFGAGYGDYHTAVDPFRAEAKLQYYTDIPEVYNVATSEPFTHDIWLKALVQTGLVGLLALGWFVAALLGRALRLYGQAHSELALGLALGAAGGILGFALCGIFTETLARGLAIPFVFVCSLVLLGERIVHGEKGSGVERLKSDEY